MNDFEEKMVEELYRNEPTTKLVRIIDYLEKEILPTHLLANNIIFVKHGVLHTEVKVDNEFCIFNFIQSGEVFYPNHLDEIEERQVVVDCDTTLIILNYEFFLNYATMKPPYMKWLLEKTNLHLQKVLYESTKQKDQDAIMMNLDYIHDILEQEGQDSDMALFDLFTKRKLASYCGVSRSTFYTKLKDLEEAVG
ncbi:Crp/Fnr family transcriptional regulator [Listeria rustica]|uniref:Crp/Fnr family transcriptional regulator n=1 Tax=Listeria rustica TaxID=2713503 RepID=A0A7W1T789_9LIST|nr:Crp/Fnr family transcriptional regulator [Listeria rustica]MBA3926753.1 Crp/Fnr family transcriptional regulator [Listeria rustica]